MSKSNGTMTGNRLSDQVVASDMLIFAKSGVKIYASAITEATTPAVRKILKKQLDEAISFQEQLSAFVINKGWYNADNINEQLQKDLTQSQNTLDHIGQ